MTKIKPPIIVSDGGDLGVFSSIEDMENYVEYQDAEDENFEFFDSTGNVLRVYVGKMKVESRWCWNSDYYVRAARVDTDNIIGHQPEKLKAVIVRYFSGSGMKYDVDSLEESDLESLVMLLCNYLGKPPS